MWGIFVNTNRIPMMRTYKILLSFFLILMSGMGFSQSVPSYVPTNGLVGWWGFNGNAQDGSGNGNHGTVNGATLTTDRFGNQNAAYSYDGSSSIIVNDHLSLRPGHITISVWFLSSGLGTGDNALVTKTRIGDPWSSLGGEQYTLFQVLHSGVSGQLNPGLTEGGFNIKRNGNCVNGGIGWYNITQPNLLPGVSNWSNLSGVWVNLIATYDGVTMKLFKDGVLSGTFLPPPGLIDNCSGGTLNFGRYWDTRNFFNGKLDDIGIWNRALSQQEINSLYNSQLSQPCTTSVASNLNISGCGFAVLSNGDTVNQSGTYLDTLTTILGCDSILNQIVTIQPSSTCNPIPAYVPTNGLVGWWGFNGNAQDGSGNGNHGMVNGATLTTDRFGNQNKAYEFDGTDDYISVNNSNSLSLSQYSISLWSKIDTLISWFPGRQLISKGCEWPIGVGVSYRIYFENTYYVMDNWAPSRSLLSNLNNSFNSNWSHLVFTYDGQGNSMYINGVLLGNATQNSALVSSLEPLLIGARKFASSCTISGNYSGKLDDIGIWNRALTSQEIVNLYNSQLPTQTSLCLPTITTTSPSSVGVDSVVIGGDISNDGGSSIVLRGICYSTSPNPNMGNQRTEDGSGTGSFNTVLRGLTSSTMYYARSYAKNSNGVVVYGNEVSFTTSASLPGIRCPGTPTVTDIDGNIYNTVQIGGQCWTQSNLKVSKYRNGDNIPTGLTNSAWQNTTSGACAIYDNNSVNDGLYGKLYNHYAVTDSRGLCPTGWHVSEDVEWTTLENYLGGSGLAGAALKSTATQPTPGGWNPPNTGATNSTGFTALPGGIRRYNLGFVAMHSQGYWWTSSVGSGSDAWLRAMYYDAGDHVGRGNLSGGHSRSDGFSVRCLKD